MQSGGSRRGIQLREETNSLVRPIHVDLHPWRVVHPVRMGGDEIVMVFRKQNEGLLREAIVLPAHFVRLIEAHGLSEWPP